MDFLIYFSPDLGLTHENILYLTDLLPFLRMEFIEAPQNHTI